MKKIVSLCLVFVLCFTLLPFANADNFSLKDFFSFGKKDSLSEKIYTGVMPGMTWDEVVSNDGKKYYISNKKKYEKDYILSNNLSFGGSLDINSLSKKERFVYFGYPVEKLDIRFDTEYKVDLITASIDLGLEYEVEKIKKEIYDQLCEIGTCAYKDTGKYSCDFTFTIDDSEYAIYCYVYENASARYKQYMEIKVIMADSGYLGLS